MKKIIQKKVYNTDTALKIHAFPLGIFGDPAGYEESLYQTRSGNYFLHGIGGMESKYPNEEIVPLTKQEVDFWLAEHKV